MKTYEELRELAKEVQIKQDAELQKAIDEQICKIEQRIADELFSGAKEIEWYGKLYP